MKSFSILMLSSLFAIAAFAAEQQINVNLQPNAQAPAPATNNTIKIIQDSDLTKQIRDKLSASMFSKGYEDVSVRVYNGHVQLGGSVPTNADKEKIEREVRHIEGVQALDSNIAVRDATSAPTKESARFPADKGTTPADEQLNKKIRDKVSSGILWDSYTDVILVTDNGIVLLQGTIKDLNDQKNLVGKIEKIQGVRAVRSNLTQSK